MQPGTPIAEVSRVANRELVKRGYQAVDSPKRIGHGIGMSRAEPPSLNEVETEIYRPGMVLALEPKVRSEKSAVHLEEDVLITEKGPEFLTTGCRDLSVVPIVMDAQGILYLSNEDVKKVLDLGRAIEITEQALRDHSEGRVIWSTPEDLAIKPEQGWQSWVTGCALATEPVAGFRIRSIKAAGGSRDASRPPRGPRRILILSDREGGEIRAIMDEDWCHAVRTAAAASSRHARARAQGLIHHGDARRRRHRPRRRAGDGQGFSL